MHVIRRRGWEIHEHQATPENLFFNRRRFHGRGRPGRRQGSRSARGACRSRSVRAEAPDPSAGLYPFKKNEKYTVGRPVTDEKIVEHYNNFYEFGDLEGYRRRGPGAAIRPWTVEIAGLVEKPSRSISTTSSARCRSRSASIGTAASRRGRW